MRQAVARSAGQLVNSPVAAPTAVAAVLVLAVVSVAQVAVPVAASATVARHARCTPRPARVAGGRPRCLSSRAKIAPSIVATAISPSRVPSVLVLLADRAGSRYDTGYCEPE